MDFKERKKDYIYIYVHTQRERNKNKKTFVLLIEYCITFSDRIMLKGDNITLIQQVQVPEEETTETTTTTTTTTT